LRLDRTLNPERVHGLYASAEAEPLSESPDLRSTSSVVFRGPKGVEVETTAPLVKAALIHLGKAWPRHIHFAELLEIVRRRLAGVEAEQSGAEQRDEARDLGEALLRGCLAGLVELHAHAPAFVTEVSERPVASALARVQLRRGDPVATLRHTTLKIEDSLSRHLVGLLDGTRDRSALVRELAELVESGDASLPRDGAPVVDARQALSEGLDENLKSLARSAVLVG
jgi:hypothetical protein